MAYIVALTGGIGSGKTTIANAFAALGVPIVDADIISRQVVEPGSPALAAIVAHFGQDILLPDSTLNRPLLRHKIFSNPQQKAWLNALLHPLIQQETQRQIKNTDALYVLWVVPLLIENNISHLADRVLVVDVTPEEQIQRTITRDNITRQHVERIIAAQASRAERLSLADDIISNHDGEHQQQDDIVKLHQKYQQLAKQAQQENAKMNETTTFVIYEHPLNEKVRSWLRLETLLSQIFALQHIDSYTSGIAFFRAVSELIEVLDRGEVRSELIKELDKQHQRLVAWSEAPYVDKEIIVGLLADVNNKQVKVKTAPRFAHQLRGDKIISMVRQRLSIPGGYCGFDLPLLQLWLNLPQPERDQRMSLWLDGLLPLKESLDVILLLIRNSGYFELIESHNGFYQDSVEDKYLLRIKLPVNELIYPQISGHKTRFAIRFLHFDSEHGIVPPILKFELASC